jgi:hypothetical protein
MSPEEIGWRVQDAGRDLIDRGRFHWRIVPGGSGAPDLPAPTFSVTAAAPGAWVGADRARFEPWLAPLVARADAILRHRFTFFNLADHDLGTPIDWNRDHESGVTSPMSFAPAIDYRDAATAGDAKNVWEPSRHQQLVVLARAYRATGDAKYARGVTDQIISWLDQSPFGYGMNWRSPLELAIRAINWIWALDMTREAGTWAGAAGARIRQALALHIWEVSRKYSRGSSANNHLIGEAAGVFVASMYCRNWPGAAERAAESRAILEREILLQSNEDGGTREQATGYHLFVLQFYLATGLVARRAQADFSDAYWRRYERMLEFASTLTEGGPLPMIGDADDGYVLDLGSAPGDARGLLSVGAGMFNRQDFAAAAGGYQEWAFWTLGEDTRTSIDALAAQPRPRLRSAAFPQTGYYVLQSGDAKDSSSVSAVIDCGELGFGPLAAHGHADALSFVLRVGGADVLVDPGTYDYFTYPDWRRYFRTTPAHNTVTVDGLDQSTMTGPFMWSQRASASCTAWEPSAEGGVFQGEHDGYVRLADPVRHRRRISLDAAARTLSIVDEIECTAEHRIELYFHFAETCAVRALAEREISVGCGGNGVTLTVDDGLTLTATPASELANGGWVSRGYHRKAPAPVAVATAVVRGPSSFTTTVRF